MDIDLHDVDLPTTKEKRKRVSTEISDREKFNAFPEEDNYNSKVLSAFSGSQSSLPKKRDSTEIFDRKKFIAVLEEDSDHNSELWSAFTVSRSSLPKKGDLVVYFPQGHLEYEDPLPRGQPPKEEVRTYGLQPQIICRVEHVQLLIKEADDEICANINLQPEPEVNSEEIEDCIWDEDGRLDPISTPNLFSKIFEWPDYIIESLTIPPKAATEFFCWESMDLQNGVTAKDFHGNEWKFPLIRDIKNGNWLLGWSEFASARKLEPGETVVFLRCAYLLAYNEMNAAWKNGPSGSPISAQGSPIKLADPFDFGGGIVNPNEAAEPGLVYDMTTDDYIHYLCAMSYNNYAISGLLGKPTMCPTETPSILDVNLPSITISSIMNSTIVLTRTVTNVGDPKSVYKAVIEPPVGIIVSVKPEVLVFDSATKKMSYSVAVSTTHQVNTGYYFGSLTWTDGIRAVRIPLSVRTKKTHADD